jgi:hypothetical protein
MNCKININMDNEAFSENPEYELARILKDLSARIENTVRKPPFYVIRDINGNKVGECIIE